MLTPNDGSADGGKLEYLREENPRSRYFDPELFDHLKKHVLVQGVRDVKDLASSGLIWDGRYWEEILTKDHGQRQEHFETMLGVFSDRDLIFFDPDNGMEVASCPKGRKGSPKYLYRDEIVRAHTSGRSLMIYQHFPRVLRDEYVNQRIGELRSLTSASHIYSLRTSFVVFFLVVHPNHSEIGDVLRSFCGKWGREFDLKGHLQDLSRGHFEGVHSVGV
jgi:hypothetical protein